MSRRNNPPNRFGCKPDADVCVAHDMPLVCRHGCVNAVRHDCKDQQSAPQPRPAAINKAWTDEFRRGMEHAANLYESVNPASDMERHHGDPGAGAMGAVIEFRDLIRKEARELLLNPVDSGKATP